MSFRDMIAGLTKGKQEGQAGGKALQVLIDLYGTLSLDYAARQSLLKIMQELIVDRGFGGTYDEHELAILCLAFYCGDLESSPNTKAEVTNYIRIAKGAQRRGLVPAPEPGDPLVLLFNAAHRLGLDPEKIDAA